MFCNKMFRPPSRGFFTSLSSWHKRGKKLRREEVHLKGTKEFVVRQLSDPYVKQRRIQNYRCRSAFKLLEINEKHQFLKPDSVVVDLGAAPGSWSQVAKDEVGEDGVVIAVDLLRFAAIEGVHLLIGDFTDPKIQEKIEGLLRDKDDRRVNVVMCDAAPKASGVKAMDHDVIVNLVLFAAKFALRNLSENGTFLFKLYQGNRLNDVRQKMEMYFNSVKFLKPDASRKESYELYLLCSEFKFSGVSLQQAR